jgi:hypothetical protein
MRPFVRERRDRSKEQTRRHRSTGPTRPRGWTHPPGAARPICRPAAVLHLGSQQGLPRSPLRPRPGPTSWNIWDKVPTLPRELRTLLKARKESGLVASSRSKSLTIRTANAFGGRTPVECTAFSIATRPVGPRIDSQQSPMLENDSPSAILTCIRFVLERRLR